MKMRRKHRLIEIEWPEFGHGVPPLQPAADEFASRIELAKTEMEKLGLTHLVVYGDREHFANLAYLTGFDPRFEEAVLIIGLQSHPLILVGNECAGYLNVSPLYTEGRLRSETFQPFSLLNMPRGNSRLIKDIFAGEGINEKAIIGCVGWKYFADSEQPDGAHAIDVPAYLVDTLRQLASRENVVNATGIFNNPDHGLRTFCSIFDIAYFEYTNILASEGMKRMLFGLREGMVDYEFAKLMEYNGIPLGCHPTLITAQNKDRSLSGPIGAVIRRGDPLAANVCYWGSNIARAGWVISSSKDLLPTAQDYVENFAGVYFEVMNSWFSIMKIGTPGDKFDQLIKENLPYDRFGIFFNPGHLIHLDEWLSSPIYPGSKDRIHSGMAIQVDVIPSSPVYFSTRMEDGIVIADDDLRRHLRERFPECYSRCQMRRDFMSRVLGFEVPEQVLPLSNIPAIVPPFFLRPNTIFALEP